MIFIKDIKKKIYNIKFENVIYFIYYFAILNMCLSAKNINDSFNLENHIPELIDMEEINIEEAISSNLEYNQKESKIIEDSNSYKIFKLNKITIFGVFVVGSFIAIIIK